MLVALVATVLAVWQVGRGGAWRPAFLFDEQWRVDFIRSADVPHEMLTHDTPIPYGWVLLMKPVTALVPFEPFWWRAVAAAAMVVGLLLLAVLLVRVGRRGRRPLPLFVGGAAAAALVFLGPVHSYLTYFNNYGFEVLYVALTVLAAEALDRARWALPALCALVALAPLFVLGGLMVLPGVTACAVWWAWRSVARVRHLLALAASGVVATGLLAVVYVQLYRPVSAKPSIGRYWVELGSSLGGRQDLLDLLGKLAVQLRDAAVGQQAAEAGGPVLMAATLVVATGAVVGAVSVWRRWPWLLVIAVSAQAVAVLASATTRWPMTVERVNLSFQLLLLATVLFGVAEGVSRIARPRWVAVPVLVALTSGLWFRHEVPSPTVFGRGLWSDLALVAASTAPHNLVVQYHPLAHFYAHDELVNTTHPGHTFHVVAEGQGELGLRTSIDAVIAREHLAPGDLLWCVLPFEIGPAGTAEACRFHDPRLLRVVDRRGRGSTVRAYVVR